MSENSQQSTVPTRQVVAKSTTQPKPAQTQQKSNSEMVHIMLNAPSMESGELPELDTIKLMAQAEEYPFALLLSFVAIFGVLPTVAVLAWLKKFDWIEEVANYASVSNVHRKRVSEPAMKRIIQIMANHGLNVTVSAENEEGGATIVFNTESVTIDVTGGITFTNSYGVPYTGFIIDWVSPDTADTAWLKRDYAVVFNHATHEGELWFSSEFERESKG